MKRKLHGKKNPSESAVVWFQFVFEDSKAALARPLVLPLKVSNKLEPPEVLSRSPSSQVARVFNFEPPPDRTFANDKAFHRKAKDQAPLEKENRDTRWPRPHLPDPPIRVSRVPPAQPSPPRPSPCPRESTEADNPAPMQARVSQAPSTTTSGPWCPTSRLRWASTSPSSR